MSLVLQNKLCKSISVTRKSDTLKAVHKLDVNIALRFEFAIGMFIHFIGGHEVVYYFYNEQCFLFIRRLRLLLRCI